MGTKRERDKVRDGKSEKESEGRRRREIMK